MSRRRDSRGPYARAVEEAVSRLKGRPVVLSPREWTLVADWHARGIPLAVVLEVLEEAIDRAARGAERPRTLSYLVPAVEEAWEAVRSGQTPRIEARDDPLPAREETLRTWREVARRAGGGTALGDLVTGLLARLASGEDPARVDRELDETIASVASREQLEEANETVRKQLGRYRDRMTEDVYERTRRRVLTDELRRRIDLPRLSLPLQ